MKAVLYILATITYTATTCDGIVEFSHISSKTLSPADPDAKKIQAKVVNPNVEIILKIGEPEDNDEIRLYPEGEPEKRPFRKSHHKCGTRIGIKLTEDGPYFCNLNYINFAIEGIEYFMKNNWKRTGDKIIQINIFFKYKKTNPMLLEIPVFQIPWDVANHNRSALEEWAKSNQVVLAAPVNEKQLKEIEDTKRFKLNFEWFKGLVESYGVYRSSVSWNAESHKPGINYYSTRPIALSEEFIKQLEGVINNYKRNQG